MDKRKKELIKQYKKEINIINEMMENSKNRNNYNRLYNELLHSFDKVISLTYDQI